MYGWSSMRFLLQTFRWSISRLNLSTLIEVVLDILGLVSKCDEHSSGGGAQRVKLALEVAKAKSGRSVYINWMSPYLRVFISQSINQYILVNKNLWTRREILCIVDCIYTPYRCFVIRLVTWPSDQKVAMRSEGKSIAARDSSYGYPFF